MSSLAQKMRNILDLCQDSTKSHPKLLNDMKELYNSYEKTTFLNKLIGILRHALIKFENSKFVDFCLLFVAKFVVRIDIDQSQDVAFKDSQGEPSSFLTEFIKVLIEITTLDNAAARLRSCQLLAFILTELVNENGGSLDELIFERLLSAFLDRSKDKKPKIRAQSVGGLAKLQDSHDKHCPAIAALQFLCRSDPVAEVRSAALSRMFINKSTLDVLIEKTRDVSETVRKSAYAVFASKVSPKHLSIEQRNDLLKTGLRDCCESVQNICRDSLLASWIKVYDDNVLELLYKLDLVNSENTAEIVVNAYFTSKTDINDLVDEWASNLDEDLFPLDLTCSKAFYWRHLYIHLKKEAENTKSGELQNSLLEKIDDIAPTLVLLTKYVDKFVRDNALSQENSDLDAAVKYEFTVLQLLHLLESYDKNDEAGRTELLSVVKNMLSDTNLNTKFIPSATRLLFSVEKFDGALNWIGEIVSDFCLLDEQIEQPDVDDNEILFKVESTNSANNLTNDSLLLIRGLSILVEILRMNHVRSLIPILRSMLDNLVLKCIQNEDPAVRNLAFTCLGLSCVLDKPLATKYIIIFLQTIQVDIAAVQKTALQAIFDLLLLYGSNIVTDLDFNAGRKSQSGLEHVTSLLVNCLDSECTEIRTIVTEGFVKLLYHQRFYSPKLLARLILLWFNPTTKDCSTLRRCLAVFFPKFAFSNFANQEALEQAFMTVIRNLFNCRYDHPLAKVDATNLAQFMVHLTDPDHLSANAPGREVSEVFCQHNVALIQSQLPEYWDLSLSTIVFIDD